MAHDTLERHLAQGQQLSALKNKIVELGFFSKGRERFIEAMADGASDSFRLNDDGLTYSFSEPVFVNTITVESANDQDIKIKYEVQGISTADWTSIAETGVSESDGHSVCKVNAFIKSFKVASGSSGFFSPTEKVKKIKIDIFSTEDLLELPGMVAQYKNLKRDFDNEFKKQVDTLKTKEEKHQQDVQAFNERVALRKASLQEEQEKHNAVIESLKTETLAAQTSLKSIEEDIIQKTNEQTNLDLAIKSANESRDKIEVGVKDLQSRSQDLTNVINEKTEEVKIKSQQTAQLNDKLQQLQNDVSLFADDAAGFAKQAQSQNTRYLWLLAGVIVFSFALAAVSVFSTIQVFEAFKTNPQLGVWNLIGIKAFLLVFMGFAFTFAYKVSRILLDEVISNNRKKLEISKVSILAKDISDSASYGLDLSIQEKLQLKMKIRMPFMRDVLSGEYDGSKKSSLTSDDVDTSKLERFVKPVLPALNAKSEAKTTPKQIEGNA